MFMPAGVHLLKAGFNRGEIAIWVKVEKTVADRFNSQLKANRKEKRKMFIATDETITVAAFWPVKFRWKPRHGLFLTCRQAVADKLVTGCASACFGTKVDYAKTQTNGTMLSFQDGAVGSNRRPAKPTHLAPCCIGTLTPSPAFRTIKPINHTP